MNAMRSGVTLWVLAVCLLAVAGCQTTESGVTNRVGTIKAMVDAKPAAVIEAAQDVLDEMELVIVNSESTSIDGRITARTAQDMRVRIDADKVGENVSEISIRVGKIGDTELSLTILREIKEELGIVPDEPEEDSDTDAEAEDSNGDGK